MFSKASLLKVVKAARMAIKVSTEFHGKIFIGGYGDSALDFISEELCEALYLFSGERLTVSEDFDTDSRTMKLLRSDRTDEMVADEFIRLHSENFAWMNKPETMERDRMRDSVKKNGGYLRETPEGDWT